MTSSCIPHGVAAQRSGLVRASASARDVPAYGMASARRFGLAVTAIVVAVVPATGQTRATGDRGIIIGLVTAKDNGRPLPFADIAVERHGLAAFASAAGQFRIEDLPL